GDFWEEVGTGCFPVVIAFVLFAFADG
ncbi:hypothetical protein EVA_18730, partial [gut metagenome]